MPPKAVASVPLTLKLKWQTNTVCILVKSSSNIKEVKKQLASALNGSQVLAPDDGDQPDDDDIDIPIPTHGELDEDEAEQIAAKNQQEEPEEINVDPSTLRIGLPNDRDCKSFKDITNATESLDALGIKEHSILAFAIGDEKFDVETLSFEAE